MFSLPTYDGEPDSFPGLPPFNRKIPTNDTNVSLRNIIETPVSMGIRVLLDVPFLADDHSPLFLIRVGPSIPLLPSSSQTDVASPLYREWISLNPIRPGFRLADLTQHSPITVIQHSQPPAFALHSNYNRGWVGSMNYYIRMTSNTLVTGNLIAVPFYAYKERLYPFSTVPSLEFIPLGLRYGDLNEGMANSHIPFESSITKNASCTIPYQYPTKYYDNIVMKRRIHDMVAGDVFEPDTRPHYDNYIAVYLRGAASATSLTNLVFEIDYSGGRDFEFVGPVPIPNTIAKVGKGHPSISLPPFVPDTPFIPKFPRVILPIEDEIRVRNPINYGIQDE